MSESKTGSGDGRAEAHGANAAGTRKVQCPNCCRMAPVTNRSMGLLFFQCELCGTEGATPDEPPR